MSAKRTRNRLMAALSSIAANHAEQKRLTNERLAQEQREINARLAEYHRQHPVSSGIVPMVDYHEPAFAYHR